MNRSEYDAQMKKMASEAYAEHRLVRTGDDRWLIRGTDAFYWAEVVVLAGNRLLVHGDVEAVLFKGSQGDGPLGLVSWIARSGIDYLSGKIEADSEQRERFEWDVFQSDIEAYLDELCEDSCESEEAARKEAEVLRGVLSFPHEDERAIKEHLYDQGVDPETFGRWGRVTVPRLYYAQAAVARLHVLLKDPELISSRVADLNKGAEKLHEIIQEAEGDA